MIKLLTFLLVIGLLTACQSAKEGFTLKKKDNADEFLVEKKSPLVMPPDYNELPNPEDFQSKKKDKKEDEFEKIISSSKNTNTKKTIKKTNIEESVFKKIK